MWRMRSLIVPAVAALTAGGLWVGWPAPAAATTVRVGRGDTLSAIAARYHTTVAAIVRANGLADGDRILAGQSLTVPAGTSSGPGGGALVVEVGRGQTLTAIAARYNTTVSALVQVNGLADGDRILAGQRLTVPVGAGGSGSAGSGSAGSGSGGSGPRRPSAAVSRELVPVFQRWAAHYGVPAPLLEALTWWESGWQSGIVSSTGAVGIGQLEPATVAQMRAWIGIPSLSPWVPSDNIRMSAAFLAQLLGRTGWDTSAAVAAYYQGLASVRAVGVYPSTRHYVAGILAYDQLFAAGAA